MKLTFGPSIKGESMGWLRIVRSVIVMAVVFSWASCGSKGGSGAEDLGMPVIVEVSAEPSAESVVLSARVDRPEAVTGCGFFVDSGEGEDRIDASMMPGGAFSAEVNGLKSSTSYRYHAFVTNGVNELLSADFTFMTMPDESGGDDDPADSGDDGPGGQGGGDDSDNPGGDDDPETPVEGMVFFKDKTLKAWVVEQYDTDGDGEINFSEAEQISWIDVDGRDVESVLGIECCPNLAILTVNAPFVEDTLRIGKLREVDLSGNPHLRELNLCYHQISSIDLSHNPGINQLYLHCDRLAEIDLSHTPHINIMLLGSNFLKTVDMSKCVEMDEAHLDNNLLEEMIVGENEYMRTLFCNDNKLKTLDLSGCPNLSYLNCAGNPDLSVVYLKAGTVVSELIKDEHTEIVYK